MDTTPDRHALSLRLAAASQRLPPHIPAERHSHSQQQDYLHCGVLVPRAFSYDPYFTPHPLSTYLYPALLHRPLLLTPPLPFHYSPPFTSPWSPVFLCLPLFHRLSLPFFPHLPTFITQPFSFCLYLSSATAPCPSPPYISYNQWFSIFFTSLPP